MSQSPIDQALAIAAQHLQAGRLSDAEMIYRQILMQSPGDADCMFRLGLIASKSGRADEGIRLIRRAISLSPRRADYWAQLGQLLRLQNQMPAAVASMQRAISLSPDDARWHYMLGNMLQVSGHYEQAVVEFERAIGLKPDYAEAIGNLGSAYKDTGRLNEAIACYRRALELKPDGLITHDNLLLALLYHPDSTPQSLFAEYQKWNQQFAGPLAGFIPPHDNVRDSDRPIRIGYVSPDFANHAVGRFMFPLLAGHDRKCFSVCCYSQIASPDEITTALQRHADHWRNISMLSDEQVAAEIRRDQIDILVNLALHTGRKNRLLVFGRRPAPVQVAYLGYAGGCGVEAIDYRLTDPHLDPDESEDGFYLQKPVRISGTYWCYQPFSDTLPLNALPALSSPHVTLGCLNNFTKVSDGALELWARIMTELPDSRFVMHAPQGRPRDHVLRVLNHRGIAADRVEFVSRMQSGDYFLNYHRIDIALDPFPFAGGTTTCDALWMGVPVVTLAGGTPVGRAGVSILTNAGLPEWIARSKEEYLKIVLNLAADLPRLAAIRANLRDKMHHSALMDVTGHVRGIEAAYRTLWRKWCEQS
jgi:predicted O-linked N-acetylglucosamine transferase (SPINDLY family)